MIPYIPFKDIHIGSIPIHVWGFFVALGIILGTMVAINRAKGKVPQVEIVNAGFYVVLFGFLGSRLLSLAETNNLGLGNFINPNLGGLSEFGGVVTAVIVGLIFLRLKRLSVPLFLDVAGPALLLAEGISRIGCFAIHDHIGKQTSFFLATNFDGVLRHDIGLYLSLVALLGFLFVLAVEKAKKLAPGNIGLISLAWFFGARFLLDFLKADDWPYSITRYWGLSLAQYLAIFFTVMLLYSIKRINRSDHSTA